MVPPEIVFSIVNKDPTTPGNSAVQEHGVGSPAVSEGTGCCQSSAKLLCEWKKFLSSLSRVSVGHEEPHIHCLSSSSTPWAQKKSMAIHIHAWNNICKIHTCLEYMDPTAHSSCKLFYPRMATTTINWSKEEKCQRVIHRHHNHIIFTTMKCFSPHNWHGCV